MQANHTKLGAVRSYAEGGLITQIKRDLNKLVGNNPDAMKQRGRSAQIEAPPATSVPAGYSSGTPTKDNPAGIKFAKGGEVNGKGTGTSDDIHIMASNGEYMVKAAAVKKLGVPFMNKLNAIADGDKASAKNPRLGAVKGKYEVGGGVTPEDRVRQRQLVAKIPTGGSGAGPTAPNGNSVADSFGSTELGRNVLNTASALGGAAPVFAGARALVGASRVGQALGTTGQAAVSTAQAVGPYGVPAAALGALNSASQPAQAPAPIVQPAPVQQTQPVGAARPVVGGGQRMGMQDPRIVTPQAQAAPALGAVSGQVTRDGNSYSGGNVSGLVNFVDKNGNARPSGGGFVAGTGDGTFTYGGSSNRSNLDGQVNAALDAAAARGDTEALRQYYGGNFGTRVAGDDAEFALMNNGKPMTARKLGAISKARAERAATGDSAKDRAFNERKFGAEQAGRGEDRKLAREKFDVDAAGAKLDQASKARLDAAQAAIADPKSTPAQRKTAVEVFDSLMGKRPEVPRAFAVPGGQALTVQGVPYTQASTVFNPATNSFVTPPQKPTLDSDPKAVDIRDNKSMTREQKAAALKQLGYQ